MEQAVALAGVDGVVGVTLGGSRARGTHRPDSDVDLGIYVDGEPDRAALRTLARAWGGPAVELGDAGSWGLWVDSGAWLTVDGTAVDWILRDLGRVRAVWDAVRRGDHGFHTQPGHPLGFWDAAYVGELATSRVLADPSGALTALRERLEPYPPALRAAMIEGLWQADFVLAGARKAATRGDVVYVAHCLAQALALGAHAHHARAGVWVTNEKGLVPSVAALPHDTLGFTGRATEILAGLDAAPATLLAAVDAARGLIADCRAGPNG